MWESAHSRAPLASKLESTTTIILFPVVSANFVVEAEEEDAQQAWTRGVAMKKLYQTHYVEYTAQAASANFPPAGLFVL